MVTILLLSTKQQFSSFQTVWEAALLPTCPPPACWMDVVAETGGHAAAVAPAAVTNTAAVMEGGPGGQLGVTARLARGS